MLFHKESAKPTQELLDKIGIKELNPVQKASIKSGLLERKNMIIASPTASGKTAIAEMAILKNFMSSGKSIYLSPLKALASEKFNEFRKKYTELGMKISMSIGDYDNNPAWLGRSDLIIMTNEKMDSLIRHNAKWIENISLIVVDEIHTLGDSSRGPTLEFVLTHLRRVTKAQILGLSATISNADELADWLDAKLVKSNYRPIKLHQGIFFPSDYIENQYEYELDFTEKNKEIIHGKESENAMCKDILTKKKQGLFFLATRRSAEAVAEKLGKTVSEHISSDEKAGLAKIATEIEHALPVATKQCKRLADIVRHGAAFHHAGLVAKQREIIENNFRAGAIKMLAATVTLAYGVNLPAWRVIIRDVKRFGGHGAEYMSAMEIQQCMGRAGRPSYDTEGEALIAAKTDTEAEELKERYILSDPEPIESNLSNETALRIYTLVLIANNFAERRSDLVGFFEKTFFAHQMDMADIDMQLDRILKQLSDFRFITIGEKDKFISEEFVPAFDIDTDKKLLATKIGKRVSELYIDPLSAHEIMKRMQKLHDIEHLMTITKCTEMYPLLYVKQNEEDEYATEIENHGLDNVPKLWDVEYRNFLAKLKTSLLFFDWMNEKTEDHILERFNLPPGELYNKIKNAEWMLFAARELALIMEKTSIANEFNRLLLRIKHGVKEELLPLVSLPNIGRVRARMLWHNKIRNISDIKKVPDSILSEIIGQKIAKKLKEEINKGIA